MGATEDAGMRRFAAGRTGRTYGGDHLTPSAASANELGQLRDDLVEIAHDPEVAEVEDGRIRVLVDRDDRPGTLHPDLVLNGARDAAGDVQPGRDGLPCLPDLGRVRVPACVDDGAGRADSAAEGRRELFAERERLGRAETAAARDDDVCILDRRPARLLLRLLDEGGQRREVGKVNLEVLDGRGAARLDRIERSCAHERDSRSTRPPHVDENRVAERGPLAHELVTLQDEICEVPVKTRFEARRETCGDIRCEHGRAEGNCVRARLPDERRERVDPGLRKRGCERFVLRHVHGRRSVSACAACDLASLRAENDSRRLAERGRLREHAQAALLELSVVVLEEDEKFQISLLSSRYSTIFSAPLPSSSILTWSPREGGGPSSSTVVFEPASPTNPTSMPIAARSRVSCGFDFAPMIPLR